MIICPITNKQCEGKSCFQVKSETILPFLLACEKIDKANIYLKDKYGNLVKVE